MPESNEGPGMSDAAELGGVRARYFVLLLRGISLLLGDVLYWIGLDWMVSCTVLEVHEGPAGLLMAAYRKGSRLSTPFPGDGQWAMDVVVLAMRDGDGMRMRSSKKVSRQAMSNLSRFLPVPSIAHCTHDVWGAGKDRWWGGWACVTWPRD